MTDNFRNTGFFNNTATSIWCRSPIPTIVTPVTFRQSATDADNHLRRTRGGGVRAGPDRAVALRAGARPACASIASISTITTTATATRSTASTISSRRAPALVVKPVAPLSRLRQLQRVVPAQLRRSVLVADDDHAAGRAGEVQQLRGGREVGRPPASVVDDGRVSAEPHQHAIHRSERSDAHRADRAVSARTGSSSASTAHHAAVEHRRRLRVPGCVRDAARPPRRARARRSAQVPHHTFSLWNNYQVHPRVSARRSASIYRIGHVRGDRQHRDAAWLHRAPTRPCTSRSTRQLRLQRTSRTCSTQRYYVNADSNTNISPGFPRALRVSLVAGF